LNGEPLHDVFNKAGLIHPMLYLIVPAQPFGKVHLRGVAIDEELPRARVVRHN
jgi:hypothetical protein